MRRQFPKCRRGRQKLAMLVQINAELFRVRHFIREFSQMADAGGIWRREKQIELSLQGIELRMLRTLEAALDGTYGVHQIIAVGKPIDQTAAAFAPGSHK